MIPKKVVDENIIKPASLYVEITLNNKTTMSVTLKLALTTSKQHDTILSHIHRTKVMLLFLTFSIRLMTGNALLR